MSRKVGGVGCSLVAVAAAIAGLVHSGLPAHLPPRAPSSRQSVEQSFGLLQVERVEAFGEPAIDMTAGRQDDDSLCSACHQHLLPRPLDLWPRTFGRSAIGAGGASLILAIAFSIVLLAGAFKSLFGVIKLGTLIKFTPQPVMAGFQNAAAALLFLVQLGNVCGFDRTVPFTQVPQRGQGCKGRIVTAHRTAGTGGYRPYCRRQWNARSRTLSGHSRSRSLGRGGKRTFDFRVMINTRQAVAPDTRQRAVLPPKPAHILV